VASATPGAVSTRNVVPAQIPKTHTRRFMAMEAPFVERTLGRLRQAGNVADGKDLSMP
jgi:hypothetical protein